MVKNAFPVSGQLNTTHLLSLEALLTVIDSTEAHCQAKVLNSTAQQDQSETLLADGEGSTKNGSDAAKGKHNLVQIQMALWIFDTFVKL